MQDVIDLFEKLGPSLVGLAPTRARLETVYDNWLADGARQDGPANFIHAVVSAHAACADQTPPPDRLGNAGALRLALSALGTAERAHPCFCAMVGAGLFDHQVRVVTQWLEDLSDHYPDAHARLIADSEALLLDPEDGTRLSTLELPEDRQILLGRKVLIARSLECLAPASARAYLHATLQRGTHEAMAVPDDFWSDPGTLLPALMHGRRRICLIKTFDANGDPVTGTGFLVGPSAVLTNLHVVEAMTDHLDDPTLLEIQFDFSETTALAQAESSVYLPPADWCIARGEIADPGPENDDYWWDDWDKRKTWLGLVQDQLDFAIIRLNGAPGLQRGWYPLDPKRRRRPSGSWALHHPAAREHTLTRGQVKFAADFGHRVFHTASTVGGSSGGLILDQDGAPMALHYLALNASAPPDAARPNEVNEVLNVAIGLREIAQRLEAQGKLAALASPGILRPNAGCIDGVRPVFGRSQFFADLTELWTSETKRIMRVDLVGDAAQLRRAGKTFSAEIIKSMFRGPEHHHMLFRAGDLKVDAQRMASDALRTFADDMLGELSDPPDTTTPAYVRRLVSIVGRAIRERLSNQSVWIVLDDLDKHSLSDASGREFLATLYNQVEEIPNLRIVLIGLPEGTVISGIDSQNEIVTRIMPDDLQGLDQKFIEWLKERGGRDAAIADDGYAFLADVITSYAVGDAPLEALSEFVGKHVAPAADRMFGADHNGGTP